MKNKLYTLCIIHKHPRVLLGLKKKGIGKGFWNGFGGKVEPGEDIVEAAIREVYEEVGVRVRDIEKLGINIFHLPSEPKPLECHIFKAHGFEGVPIETDEMSPKWFYPDEIPFRRMWIDDAHWFPLFFKNKRFIGEFHFDKEQNLLKHHLGEVSHIQ